MGKTSEATMLKQLEANKEGREASQQAFGVIETRASELPIASQPRFWEYLHTLVVSKLQKNKDTADAIIDPMTDNEAVAFGKTTVPFETSKHFGLPIKNVPLDYLVWIVDNQDKYEKFRRQLIRYLRSVRISQELNR